jgi:hypothetical protein
MCTQIKDFASPSLKTFHEPENVHAAFSMYILQFPLDPTSLQQSTKIIEDLKYFLAMPIPLQCISWYTAESVYQLFRKTLVYSVHVGIFHRN